MVPTFPRRAFPLLAAAVLLLTASTVAAQSTDAVEPSENASQDPNVPPPPVPTAPTSPQPAAQPAPEPAPVPAQTVASLPATGSDEAAIGVGGQLALSGFGGLQILYQKERYHLDALISFFDAADTTVSIGGRFFWHAHKSERADFSLGAGLGLTHINDADLDILHVEAVGQIRFFVTPAVAISATMGVALQSLDGDVVGLGSDVLGGAGISYLFY